SYGAPRARGDPTRDEQRDSYVRCAGRPVADTTWYEIFAAARYCAIVVRVMNRSVARGELPADQKIWLDNPASHWLRAPPADKKIWLATPASTCLAQLLDERG